MSNFNCLFRTTHNIFLVYLTSINIVKPKWIINSFQINNQSNFVISIHYLWFIHCNRLLIFENKTIRLYCWSMTKLSSFFILCRSLAKIFYIKIRIFKIKSIDSTYSQSVAFRYKTIASINCWEPKTDFLRQEA
jgi:hypothetical protein